MALTSGIGGPQLLLLKMAVITIAIFSDADAAAGMNERLPPSELFPSPRNDVPFLVEAGTDRLIFEIHIKKKNNTCPYPVYWIPNSRGKLQNSFESDCRNDGFMTCTSTFRMEDLDNDTPYDVNVQPVTKSSTGKTVGTPWYTKEDWDFRENVSPQLTSPTTARTCSKEVPAVRDLLVHSMGDKWVALSWLLPQFKCLTRYKYFFHYQIDDEWNEDIRKSRTFWSKGTFWSDHVWHSDSEMRPGSIVPCPAWPDRHCLVVDNVAGSSYIFEVSVNRMIDNVNSSVQETKSNVSENTAPGPPQDLHCVRAQPTELELRWRCPLRPGGVLESFYVHFSTGNGILKTEKNETVGHPSLRLEYNATITGLKPSTRYNVSVKFKTSAGIEGEEGSILVWTTPADHQTSALTETPEVMTAPVETTTPCKPLEGSVAVDSQRLQGRDGKKEIPWMWIAACGVLVLLVFVSFFVGRRCGMVTQWKPTPEKDSQNNNGAKRSKLGNVRLTKMMNAGDAEEAELCAAGAPPSRTQPIYASGGYAEVDVPAGRARAAESTTTNAHHYEEPQRVADHYAEIKGDATPPEEKPYASISDPEAATSPAYYSAVQKPAPLPPPSAVKPKDVYAEVDKTRKTRKARAGVPPPPPALFSASTAPAPPVAPSDVP